VEPGQDLTTDARLLASLAGLGVRVPEVTQLRRLLAAGSR
jgi:hypothetical protein